MDRKKLLLRMFQERMKNEPVELEVGEDEGDGEDGEMEGEAPEMELADDSQPSLREQLNAEPLGSKVGDEMTDDEGDGGDNSDELAQMLSEGGRTTPLRQRVLDGLLKKKKG